jgi:hypothetical protein
MKFVVSNWIGDICSDFVHSFLKFLNASLALLLFFYRPAYRRQARRLGVFCPRSWTYPLGLFDYQVPFDFAKDKQKETKFTCRRQETPPRSYMRGKLSIVPSSLLNIDTL